MDGPLSFTPDSPYFAAGLKDHTRDIQALSSFVDTFLVQVKELTESIRRTATLGNEIAHLTHSAFSEGLTAATVGHGGQSSKAGTHGRHRQLLAVLKRFGSVLKEMSSSQEMLAESLGMTLIQPLESFRGGSLNEINRWCVQYEKDRTSYEAALGKYLSSGTYSGRGSATAALLDLRALHSVKQLKQLELTRFDAVMSMNSIESHKTLELTEACISTLLAFRTHHRILNDLLDGTSAWTNEVALQQQQHRASIDANNILMERKRRDVEAVLDAMIERIDFQLPKSDDDVVAVAVEDSGSGSGRSSFSRLWGGGGNSSASSSSSSVNSGSAGNFGSRGQGLRETQRRGSGSKQGSSASSANDSSATAWPSLAEVESRMKALDMSELEALYSPLQRDHFLSAHIVKQGFVWCRSSGKMLQASSWNRHWIVLDDSKLYVVKEVELAAPTALETKLLTEMLLASIKDLSSQMSFAFEVSYANLKTITVQAEGGREYAAWMEALKSIIEKRLVAGSVAVTSGSDHSSTATRNKRDRVAAIISRNEAFGCADCDGGKCTWVVINLCIGICIECSGVHRSLGVQISKVRSLTLDELEPEEYDLLENFDNGRSNLIWEANVTEAWVKPTAQSTYAERERWIRAKYEKKLFLGPLNVPPAALALSGSDRVQAADEAAEATTVDSLLVEACRCNNIDRVLWALAHGANPIQRVLANAGPLSIVTGATTRDDGAESPTPPDMDLHTEEPQQLPAPPSPQSTWLPSALHLAAHEGSAHVAALLILGGSSGSAYASPRSRTSSDQGIHPIPNASVCAEKASEIALSRGFVDLAGYLAKKESAFGASSFSSFSSLPSLGEDLS